MFWRFTPVAIASLATLTCLSAPTSLLSDGPFGKMEGTSAVASPTPPSSASAPSSLRERATGSPAWKALRPDAVPPATPADAELIQKGLVAFNKPDARGRACVSCHSPTGLEIAEFNFSDENIIRRAEAHVNSSEAQLIVAMVHARRRQYKIDQPLDPMNDRPLQPGGAVLPGATAADRDRAFGLEIDKRLPLLTRGKIDSLAKAREAEREVLAVDLRKLPIGITFNRLSEDGFHGADHAVIADWIPDVPVDLSPESIQARDAYQADPSEANLTRLIETIPPVQTPFISSAQNLAIGKYNSLLRMQDQLVHPEADVIHPRRKIDGPFWDVAEIARKAQGVPLVQLGLPDDIRVKKEPGPSLITQFGQMKLPWYWTGWISDPGLQHTGIDPKARRAVYFVFNLFDEGPYPMHAAFMMLRKQMTSSFVPEAWNSASKQHYVMEYSSFLGNRNFERFAPEDPKAAALLRRFVVNEFRTSLYLLLDETKRSHVTDLKYPALEEARQMTEYVIQQQPSAKHEMEYLLIQINQAFSMAQQIQD